MSDTSDPLAELHRMREQMYEEEKHLSPEERLRRLRAAGDAFLKRTGLHLKRVPPPSHAASR